MRTKPRALSMERAGKVFGCDHLVLHLGCKRRLLKRVADSLPPLVLTLCSLLTAQEPTGAEIIAGVNEVMSPVNSKSVMTQTIETASGKKRAFGIEIYSANRGEKTLMRYLKPARVKGLAFLMLNHADDIWAYFPRTNRVRKMASHAKKQKVQGSDFTYEDIGSGDTWIEQFTTTNLGVEKLRGELCWKLRLDAVPEEEPSYDKMLIWVRRADYYPLQVEYFSDKGRLTKSLFMENIETVEGIPTAMKMVMENHEEGTQTIMETLSVTYDWEPPDGFFSERSLKR